MLVGLPSPNSNETALHVEGLSFLQHVVARPRQLVRQRLGRHHAIGLGFLPLEEAPRLVTVATGEVCRLDERPHQIGIAVLAVAFAFLPAVGIAGAVHAAGIGSEVADLGEAGDVAGL